MIDYKIGHGYDVHKLVEGRALILGGVDIPYSRGLLGHSDADVLVHAIMDALLGALALGDIGKHFPDSCDEFRGISSLELLKRVKVILDEHSATVGNIDATVVMQSPKLSPYINNMRENIANILSTDIDSINVKATTEERLGFTGSGEGASAHAVCILKINK